MHSSATLRRETRVQVIIRALMQSGAKFAPGPRQRPGDLWRIRRDPIGVMSSLRREFGDAVHYRVGPQHVLLLTNPDFIEEVLVTKNSSFKKGQALEDAKRLLGEGLLTSEGTYHARQRRRIQPLLRQERIEAFANIMTSYAGRTADRWNPGEPRDIAAEMSELTLAIAGKTLFDTDIESEATEVGEALADAMEVLHGRFGNPLNPLLHRLPLPATRRFDRAKERLDDLILTMITEHRQSETERHDLLTLLMTAGNADGGDRMRDSQLRDEAMTLILAGHETTAQALTWTWYLLSQNADVEALFHSELAEVLGGRPAQFDDVARLPYTRAVLAESMRLYPPAWIVGRRSLEDVEVGPYTVPAGSIVAMCQFIVHRDDRFWDQPERFDPGRWTPEREAGRPRYAYFPFGGGPRLCVGERFAWTEGILVLATIAQRWRLDLAPGHPVELLPRVTLRPRYGMQMTPAPRS